MLRNSGASSISGVAASLRETTNQVGMALDTQIKFRQQEKGVYKNRHSQSPRNGSTHFDLLDVSEKLSFFPFPTFLIN